MPNSSFWKTFLGCSLPKSCKQRSVGCCTCLSGGPSSQIRLMVARMLAWGQHYWNSTKRVRFYTHRFILSTMLEHLGKTQWGKVWSNNIHNPNISCWHWCTGEDKLLQDCLLTWRQNTPLISDVAFGWDHIDSQRYALSHSRGTSQQALWFLFIAGLKDSSFVGRGNF